jgi:hypothetical protein
MSKLAQLKKSRGANLKALQEKLEQSQQGSGYTKDERIWKPTFNKEKGKGIAIVRFLTPKEGDCFVEVKSYSFDGPGGKYYDLARDTIGEEDPIKICAINMFKKAKDTGDAALKEKAKKYLSKSKFFANVLVIKDEEKPENEGKVMIYEYGYQIHGLIQSKIKPEFDDVEAQDVFDFWDGSDFIIRMIGKEIPDAKTGKKILVPNYEKSEFRTQSELFDGDEDRLNEILEKTYNLSDFIDPKKFKTFDEVAEKFQKVTGKPYNYLKEEGLEEHANRVIEKQQEEMKTEDKTDDDTDDGDLPFDPDPASEVGDDDDPVAAFLRAAKAS